MAMSKEELVSELEQLGIDENNHMLVALLPLVHVAWADGTVQPQERELILKIARARGFADEKGMATVEKWLSTEPSPFMLHKGRKVLADLYVRSTDLGTDVTRETLEDVLAFCEGVADAAGGVFGLFGRVANEETEAIGKIAAALNVEKSKSWADVKKDFQG